MMIVVWAYLCFVPLSALCFATLRPRTAILVVLIGGWLLLPVGRYAELPPGTTFPWWIVGIALPSDMLLTKAWIPPLLAFAGAVSKDPGALGSWRPRWIDAPMAGWCLWPLLDDFGSAASPPGWIASLYVVGAWGLPWLIGRIWLACTDGQAMLLRALACSGLTNLPVALIEGSRPAMLYGLLYGPHPYRSDGVQRYLGYRPIGFLEHGNLYGLWTALAAFAAVSLLRIGQGKGPAWTTLAVVNIAIAIAAQSAGAIALLVFGLALIQLSRTRHFAQASIAAGALILLAGAVHLSGVLPLQAIAHSPVGQHVIGAMRSVGRGSFLWRISQDTKTLASIVGHPLAGTAQWDWFKTYGTRPWGQAVLLIGQYGLIGFVLAWGSLIGVCALSLLRSRQGLEENTPEAGRVLAILVLLALIDASLNAFFFSPALVAAGAIAITKFTSSENGSARPAAPERAEEVDLGSRDLRVALG